MYLIFGLGLLFGVSHRGQPHLSTNFVPFLPLLVPTQVLLVVECLSFPPPAGTDVPPAVTDTVLWLKPHASGLPRDWPHLYGRSRPLLARCQ